MPPPVRGGLLAGRPPRQAPPAAEAEPPLRLAVDALHAIHGGDHPEAALALSHLATVLRKLRRRDEAREIESRIRAVRTRR